MSVNLPSLYVQEFASTIELLVQQMDSKLQPSVMVGSGHVGEQASPVLQNGKIAQFLGFNFIHCERAVEFNGTDDQSGTSTPIMCYAKSGVYLGHWQDIQVDVSERKDLRGIPWQLYIAATFGATRLQEDKVVKIWSRP